MRIKIFTTGGSIDKTYSTRESDFIVGEPQVESILIDGNIACEYEVESLLKKDSLEISAEERRGICDRVRSDPHTKILITHGTDTMVDTAQALIGTPGKTIVVTGAMQPAGFKRTDAAFNVGSAFLAVQILPEGVYVVMNGRVFDPSKTVKNVELNRFEEGTNRLAQ